MIIDKLVLGPPSQPRRFTLSTNQTSDEFGGILVENANPVTGEATVYLDLNQNGVLETEDTNGNGTLEVSEDLNGNGMIDPLEPSTKTKVDDPSTTRLNELELYEFTDLVPGHYLVAELVQPGWVATLPVGGVAEVAVPSLVAALVAALGGGLGAPGRRICHGGR